MELAVVAVGVVAGVVDQGVCVAAAVPPYSQTSPPPPRPAPRRRLARA